MQQAIIVDIDGTIAQKHPDRDIYDLTKVHMDLPIMPVIDLIEKLPPDIIILFVSGRQESCGPDTRKWLVKYCYSGFIKSHLFMRKTGDNRCDTIIKREIYEENIKGRYNVLAVFDDRPKVIRMWREQGLFVFNCAQHDNEF